MGGYPMSDPTIRTMPIVRPVRDQYGERIVVSVPDAWDDPTLECDCRACAAQRPVAPTLEDGPK
jgi:hypothetical protein